MKKYILFVLIGLLLGVNNVSATEVINPVNPSAKVCPGTIPQNLFLGMNSSQVFDLQRFLNLYTDTQVAVSGAGSPGYETSYFGPATKRAVIKFQNKYTPDILTPAGLNQGNGFVGALTRAKISKLCDEIVSKVGIIYWSVTTDKTTYKPNEKIVITVKALNTTNEEKTLNFNSGCQVSYSIGDYDSQDGLMCTMALTSVIIPPMGSKVWTMEHDLSQHRLVADVYNLVANMSGISVAQTILTVNNGLVVVSPQEDDSWKLGSKHDIIWKFDPEVSFVVAPKFDLYVYIEMLPCVANEPCARLPYIRYIIAEDIIGTGGISKYSWKVGKIPEMPYNQDGTLTKGKYYIEVCSTGSEKDCSQSHKVFTIK